MVAMCFQQEIFFSSLKTQIVFKLAKSSAINFADIFNHKMTEYINVMALFKSASQKTQKLVTKNIHIIHSKIDEPKSLF